MLSIIFDSKILGTIQHGQGSAIVVEGTHRVALRVLFANCARHLALRLRDWCALAMRMPGAMTPVTATCPTTTGLRRQRHGRWASGVVVGAGPVGVRR